MPNLPSHLPQPAVRPVATAADQHPASSERHPRNSPTAIPGGPVPGPPTGPSTALSRPPQPPPAPMRIFLAGATGVIGIRLLPLLIADGHTVAAMTRSPDKANHLRALGAQPFVCDVFDAAALTSAISAFGPDAVVHQLTDLPDQAGRLPEFAARNDRIRTEGTSNLIAAARAATARHFLAQSIAWRPPGREHVVDQHESQVLAARGVVVRYGQLYGPGTWYPDRVPSHPRIHVDAAVQATPPLILASPGVIVLAEAPERCHARFRPYPCDRNAESATHPATTGSDSSPPAESA